MRLLVLLLLATPTLANELLDAVHAADPSAIVAASPPKSLKSTERIATCSAAADLALRLDLAPDQRAAWDKAVAHLAEFAGDGRGLYRVWAQTEIDVMRWRLKQAHDPDDGMKMSESLRELTRALQETRIAAEVHVRAASHLLTNARYPSANWYACIGGIFYMHRKMELLKLDAASIHLVKAMIEFAKAEAKLRGKSPKKEEGRQKIMSGLDRLGPYLKEKDPSPVAVRLYNDFVLLGRSQLGMDKECRLTMYSDKPAGIRYGFAPSADWRRVGDAIIQLGPRGGTLRKLEVRRSDAKDATKQARALFKEDRKRIKSKRKSTGPKKGPVNEKIKQAVCYEMSGLDAAKAPIRIRTFVIGNKGGPLFVVRIVERTDEQSDAGVDLFVRYLSLN